MQLLGEEVNTEVTVLASLRGGGDADHLARAALEDQEIANADVMAGDGDSVGSHCGSWGGRTGGLSVIGLDGAVAFRDDRTRSLNGRGSGGWSGGDRDLRGAVGDLLLFNHNLLRTVVVMMVVVAVVEGVENTIGCSVKTATEAVVLPVVVVISHIKLIRLWGVYSSPGLFFDLDCGSRGTCTSNEGGREGLRSRVREVRLGVLGLVAWLSTLAELGLGPVDDSRSVGGGSRRS